jgi:lysyl-tRNA synthetase, class II
MNDSNEHINEYDIREQRANQIRKDSDALWGKNISVSITASNAKQLTEKNFDKEQVLAGRIIGKREHGKTIFVTIRDFSGIIQCYFNSKENKDAFGLIKDLCDIGDHISVVGPFFKTKMGELTVRVNKCEVLAKCLHPIPDSFGGLQDVEIRYRQRYLDLIVHSEDIKDVFIKRSNLIKHIRRFLEDNSFIEVETPMLHPIPGGANARPFITHHNALSDDFYLRIAPELYLKRLIVAGFERVYEINRNFRNEGVSLRHNPEFTMLEYYMTYHDYKFAMSFVEDLMRDAIQKSCGSLECQYGYYIIDFEKPFERLSPKDAVIKYGNLNVTDLSEDSIDKTLKKHKIEIDSGASIHRKIFALFEELAEKNIKDPVFIVDFPIEISPLAKRDPDKPNIASRFELFIAGMEISNGFNELNDPYDQRDRFMEQVEAKEGGDDEAMHFDEDYITALQYGMPPTVGVGIGIDRLVMLITNSKSIKDVILFPTMKRKKNM